MLGRQRKAIYWAHRTADRGRKQQRVAVFEESLCGCVVVSLVFCHQGGIRSSRYRQFVMIQCVKCNWFWFGHLCSFGCVILLVTCVILLQVDLDCLLRGELPVLWDLWSIVVWFWLELTCLAIGSAVYSNSSFCGGVPTVIGMLFLQIGPRVCDVSYRKRWEIASSDC